MSWLPPAPARRLLDERRGTGAMTWIMAIMLFLTVLAAALGLGMGNAADTLSRQLAGRVTVQIVEPDPARRDAATTAIVAQLRALPMVRHAEPVDRARLAELLRPWLGSDGDDGELPVPALIDVDLSDAGADAVAAVAATARGSSPAARVDRHAAWMSPVARFVQTLTWVAAALVALLAAATATVVFLTARTGLDTHRDTIGVLHMLGSSDAQVARLFQRRIALDTFWGGVAGTILALGTIALLGGQAAALGSDMVASIGLGGADWLALLLLPAGFTALAALAARGAIAGALRRTL